MKFRYLLVFLIAIGLVFLGAGPADAEEKKSPAPAGEVARQAPRVAVLPVVAGGISREMREQYESVVVSALSRRYTVLPMQEVEAAMREVMAEVSRKAGTDNQCDDTVCYRKIGVKLNVEYVTTVKAVKLDEGYSIAIDVRDVQTGKMLSFPGQCVGCNALQLSKELSALAATVDTGDTAPAAPPAPSVGGGIGFAAGRRAPLGGEAKVEMVTPQVSGDSADTVSSLFITSDPSGAEVLLNGIMDRPTPYQNLELTPNQRIAVTLRKEMYHDKLLEFTLAPGMNKLTGVKLAPAFGSLSITSVPSGAEVWMAGSKAGTTPYRAETVKSGQHLVTVKYPLYQPVSNQVVVVEDGTETQKAYTLEVNFGTLKVASKPSGAQVNVQDGKGKESGSGKTPYSFDLESGSYRLTVGADGYDPVEANITIAAGKTVEIGEAQASLRHLEGKVTLTTEPFDESAEIFIDGVKAGTAPLDAKLAAGAHEVMAKTKKQEGKQTITVQDRKSQTVALKLKDSGKEGMVAIKGGCFEMGSDEGASDEKPVHKVCVDDFQMDRYEVTNAAFERWKPGFSESRNAEHEGVKVSPGDGNPVVNVTWEEAKGYCASKGKRLPTEAEFEYAGREGGKQMKYGWGDSEGDACKYSNVADQSAKRKWSSWSTFSCDDGFIATAPVGSFLPNGLGLYDIQGNVWEWVADWYDGNYYGQSPERNPAGPSSGSSKVLRGGSWADSADGLRAANRNYNTPVNRTFSYGFRCSQ